MRSSSLNYFQKKKQKKRKPSNQDGQVEKPKGNGISPEGWQGHYAVVFWLGGALAVRLIFAIFLFFFGYILIILLEHLESECQVQPLKAISTIQLAYMTNLVSTKRVRRCRIEKK